MRSGARYCAGRKTGILGRARRKHHSSHSASKPHACTPKCSHASLFAGVSCAGQRSWVEQPDACCFAQPVTMTIAINSSVAHCCNGNGRAPAVARTLQTAFGVNNIFRALQYATNLNGMRVVARPCCLDLSNWNTKDGAPVRASFAACTLHPPGPLRTVTGPLRTPCLVPCGTHLHERRWQ